MGLALSAASGFMSLRGAQFILWLLGELLGGEAGFPMEAPSFDLHTWSSWKPFSAAEWTGFISELDCGDS